MTTETAIAVIAYKRPRYLRVTLEALFKVNGIEKCPVSVYFDGGLELKVRRQQEEVAFKFPVDRVVFRKSNVGCLRNVVDGIHSSFKYGFNNVVYIEDDVILRPDTLRYVSDLTRDAAFYNLCQAGNTRARMYTPVANMIERSTFEPLYSWVMAGKHIGTIRPNTDKPITAEMTSHDAVFYSYLVLHEIQTRYPDKSYAAHFGLWGMNHGLNDDEKEFEQYMFSGPVEKWLPRIIGIIHREESIPDPVKSELFLPKSFRYN